MANIPIFIPHAGCKNDCAFCNQKSITGQIVPPSFEEAENIIKENLSTLGAGEHTIAFFGGSFTGIGNELMRGYLEIAQKYVDANSVKGIRLSTRPDYINSEIMDILCRYSVTNIELGAQSLDDEVLLRVNRGHTAEDVFRAADMIKDKNITLGLQMMVGLPWDSYEKSIATAEKIVKAGAGETRIYPTVILKDTPLADMYKKGEYVPMSFEDAIDTSADCYSIFFENNVRVLRIGLQNSEELKNSVVGGFYHDAIGEKVYSRVIRRNAEKLNSGEIRFAKRFLSKVLGQKKENLPFLQGFNLVTDDSVNGVCINGKYVLTI